MMIHSKRNRVLQVRTYLSIRTNNLTALYSKVEENCMPLSYTSSAIVKKKKSILLMLSEYDLKLLTQFKCARTSNFLCSCACINVKLHLWFLYFCFKQIYVVFFFVNGKKSFNWAVRSKSITLTRNIDKSHQHKP